MIFAIEWASLILVTLEMGPGNGDGRIASRLFDDQCELWDRFLLHYAALLAVRNSLVSSTLKLNSSSISQQFL